MLSIAQARGFTHYNLTEHIPRAHIDHLYPEERQANITTDDLLRTFQAYLVEARRCAVAFAADKHRPVKVLVGAELENVDGRTAECLEFVESILKDDAQQWIVEYVVGSVHHVHGIPIDFDKPMFERTLVHMLSTTEGRLHSEVLLLHDSDRRRAHLLLMLAYLDAQYALLQRFKPEVIGHFDLCRLFQPDTPMTLAGKSAVQSNLHDLLRQVGAMVKRNVAFAAAYGALFEINSASMRKGWQTPYPGEDVLDVILASNGRLCLSDDAHSHEQVGLNYHRTHEYLLRKGVEAVWLLTKADKDEPNTFPRGTKAERIPLTQLDDFWQRPQ